MKNESALRISLLIQGFCAAFLAMLLFSILLAILIFFSDWQETEGLLLIFNYFSVLLAGFYVGQKSTTKIWLNGALVGIAYVLLLTLLRARLDLLTDWLVFKKIILVGIIGAVGSVVGGIFAE